MKLKPVWMKKFWVSQKETMIFELGMRKTTIVWNLVEIGAFMPIVECVWGAFYIDFRMNTGNLLYFISMWPNTYGT